MYASILHSSHMSTKHNSVPEINVLSWLKFSKSVLSHLMLIWAKRNQLVLLAEAAGICSSKLCPPPHAHTPCKLPVLLHSHVQTSCGVRSNSCSSPLAPSLVCSGASGLNTALGWCTVTKEVRRAMLLLTQMQGVCHPTPPTPRSPATKNLVPRPV